MELWRELAQGMLRGLQAILRLYNDSETSSEPGEDGDWDHDARDGGPRTPP